MQHFLPPQKNYTSVPPTFGHQDPCWFSPSSFQGQLPVAMATNNREHKRSRTRKSTGRQATNQSFIRGNLLATSGISAILLLRIKLQRPKNIPPSAKNYITQWPFFKSNNSMILKANLLISYFSDRTAAHFRGVFFLEQVFNHTIIPRMAKNVSK